MDARLRTPCIHSTNVFQKQFCLTITSQNGTSTLISMMLDVEGMKTETPTDLWPIGVHIDLLYSAKLFCCGSFLYFGVGGFLNNLSYDSFFYCGCFNHCVFGNNLNRNNYFHLFMEVNNSLEIANTLYIAHGDNLPVYLDALFLQFFGNGGCVNRAVCCASCRNLGLDNKCHAF